MSDSTADYEQSIEAARVALGRGDRVGAEQALIAAIRTAERSASGGPQLAAALIKLGELKHEAAAEEEAESLFLRALDVSERMLGGDDLGLVPALTSLGAVRIARGMPEGAEPVLTRALAISERRLGPDHPDLAGLLNDLSRLYLKQSAHAFAEPLLLRLHAIKRSKGDDHPEVATVLASLAAVRQALGRHEAAEQLWRRVVEIRERTLAPNHFAIATAIEHLAETCSARGKLDEALRLLQRAVGMRELTLGPGHPSLPVLRERIADLQLQSSEVGIVTEAAEPRAAASDWRRALPAASSAFLAPLSPAAAESTRATGDADRIPSDGGRAVESRGSAVRDRAPAVAWEDARSMSLRAVTAGRPSEQVTSPLADDGELDDYRAADGSRDESDVDTRGSALALLRRRPTPFIAGGIGIAAVALLIVSLDGSSQASPGIGQPSTAASLASAPLAGAVPAATDSQPRDSRAANGVIDRPLDANAGTTPIPVASRPRVASDRRGNDRATSDRGSTARPLNDGPASARGANARADTDPTAAAAPAAPRITMPIVADLGIGGRSGAGARMDSLLRSTTAPSTGRESFTTRQSLTSLNGGQASASVNSEASPAFQAPQLIGSLPRRDYPPSLRANRVHGEVIVEFTVDTLGRPDMSTLLVVRSSHELFTASVRQAVPSMRFVPAQVRGQKMRAPVQVPFRFSTDPGQP
jgi:TonB family protein